MLTCMFWEMIKYDFKEDYDMQEYCFTIFMSLLFVLFIPFFIFCDLLFSPIEILAYILAKRKQRSFNKCQKKNY